MEAVFRALSDPSRRQLLDLLFARDGQTLQELVLAFSSQRRAASREPMSRFGVMKHLKLLEQAGLVITRRDGREKYHYLNPVPIHEIQQRWIDKFAEPWVSALTGLKQAGNPVCLPLLGATPGLESGDVVRRDFINLFLR